MKENAKLICQVCKKPKSPHDGMVAELIRPSLLEFIKKRMPDIGEKDFICLEDLGKFRKEYVKDVLEDELGELSTLDNEVIESLQQHEILASNIAEQFATKLTFGELLSDRIASFGGSWKFIITFGVVIVLWIAMNVVLLCDPRFRSVPSLFAQFDPFMPRCPQAPVIMMSQNRVKRVTGCVLKTITKVNLKAELKSGTCTKKSITSCGSDNQLFEIQQIQIELLEEIGARAKAKRVDKLDDHSIKSFLQLSLRGQPLRRFHWPGTVAKKRPSWLRQWALSLTNH